MGDKVKPWHNRKPKRHDEQRGKRPDNRSGQDNKFSNQYDRDNDQYADWKTDDYSNDEKE